MASFDPIQRYGASWRRFNDGSERKVVIHEGRYCLQDRDGGEPIPIPNAINPPPQRITPRTALHEAPEPPSRDNQRRTNEESSYEVTRRDSRTAPNIRHANPDSVRSPVPTRTRRPSLSQQGTSTIGTASHLPTTTLGFIQVAYSDFLECSRFIDRHPDVLSTRLESLLDAALQAKSNQDNMLALRCLQRYVIVETCRDKSPDDRRDYLALLGRREPNEPTWKEFGDKFKKISDEVSRQSQEASRPPQQYEPRAPGPQSRSHHFTDAHAHSNTFPAGRDASYVPYATPGVSYGGHGPNFPPSAYSQPAGFAADLTIRALSSTDSSRETSAFKVPGQAQAAIGRDMQPAAPAVPLSRTSTSYRPETRTIDQQQGARKSRAYSRSSNSYESHDYKHKQPTANGMQNVEYRGTSENQQMADSEQLNRNYTLRRDGAAFFSPGRVFSLMYHEPLGLKHGDPYPPDVIPRNVSHGPKGTLIYSKIRWMVVITKRKGYSVCVPISSYGGHGVGQKNMGDEAQAHAIVYPSSRAQPPGRLPGEPQFKKKPIAVDLKEDLELGAASRIHFGKLHSIEWNVKVMDIGQIARRCMPDFEEYWREEFSPRRQQRVDANTSR